MPPPGAPASSSASPNCPPPADVEQAITEGGVLFLQEATAALNIILSTQQTDSDGSITASSTTVLVPLILEDGEWRIAD